jgi:hypothetical protein
MRTAILATLLWKEILRFRYNWGLLVMVGGVLALAILLSVGARLGQIPGQEQGRLQECILLYDRDNRDALRWLQHLNQHPPSAEFRRTYRLAPLRYAPRQGLADPGAGPRSFGYDRLVLELEPPKPSALEAPWRYRAWIPEGARAESLPYRYWLEQTTLALLGTRPIEAIEEQPTATLMRRVGEEDRVPLFVTALVIFSFYLLSFNLYITSTGEERDKKALLALMLTPARPAEIVGAKVIFYTAASLLVSMLVALLYQPRLVLAPRLWLCVGLGSICYVSIGTVVLCLVRRQTTINTVSMIYLIITAVIMFLSVFLLPFFVLKHLLIENYVFRQLVDAVAGRQTHYWLLDFLAMSAITLTWILIALWFFRRHGTRIAHAGR